MSTESKTRKLQVSEEETLQSYNERKGKSLVWEEIPRESLDSDILKNFDLKKEMQNV